MADKPKKAKAVNVQVIAEKDSAGDTNEIYLMMAALLIQHHDHLAEARIALAWNLSWSADPDGRLQLGKCKKVGDLDRQLHGYDFVILLNKEAWEEPEFDTAKKLALLDHELCHAQVKRDKHDEVVKDENGKIVYRIKKHSLEEFSEIVTRHGIWKDDIRAFVQRAVRASREKRNQPLIDMEVIKEKLVENEAKLDAQVVKS